MFRPWKRIMSGTDDRANKAKPEAEPLAEDGAHTAGGAPTDQAHRDAGDGTLTGSVPAGLRDRPRGNAPRRAGPLGGPRLPRGMRAKVEVRQSGGKVRSPREAV